MIGQLTGKILAKNPPEILLQVGDIGYEILCPMPTFHALSSEKITLHTHLQIKEDAHTLYGFISQNEKILFRQLIKVSGIGPKVALAILSNLDVASLLNAVANEKDSVLAEIPGIGKKTAKKLIVELKDRLAKLNLSGIVQPIINLHNPNQKQALSALQTLGFKYKEGEKMLAAFTDKTLSTEELIRLALKNKV